MSMVEKIPSKGALLSWNKKKISVAFWKEKHLSDEKQETEENGLQKFIFSSDRTWKKRGVAILISNCVCFDLVSKHKDKERRLVLVMGKPGHKEATLCNLYAPPMQAVISVIFRTIFGLIAAETGAGDFNIILNPRLDTTKRERKKNLIEKRIKYCRN